MKDRLSHLLNSTRWHYLFSVEIQSQNWKEVQCICIPCTYMCVYGTLFTLPIYTNATYGQSILVPFCYFKKKPHTLQLSLSGSPSCVFHMNFGVSLHISTKNTAWTLIRINVGIAGHINCVKSSDSEKVGFFSFV